MTTYTVIVKVDGKYNETLGVFGSLYGAELAIKKAQDEDEKYGLPSYEYEIELGEE